MSDRESDEVKLRKELYYGCDGLRFDVRKFERELKEKVSYASEEEKAEAEWYISMDLLPKTNKDKIDKSTSNVGGALDLFGATEGVPDDSDPQIRNQFSVMKQNNTEQPYLFAKPTKSVLSIDKNSLEDKDNQHSVMEEKNKQQPDLVAKATKSVLSPDKSSLQDKQYRYSIMDLKNKQQPDLVAMPTKSVLSPNKSSSQDKPYRYSIMDLRNQQRPGLFPKSTKSVLSIDELSLAKKDNFIPPKKLKPQQFNEEMALPAYSNTPILGTYPYNASMFPVRNFYYDHDHAPLLPSPYLLPIPIPIMNNAVEPIIGPSFLRNFNNWVKGVLIREYIKKIQIQEKFNVQLKVLDLCCGMGGDMLKWEKNNISHLICADISELSIEECKKRYAGVLERMIRKGYEKKFTAEFICCDATMTQLRSSYINPSIKLNLVSCQFSFQYCFESLPQAEMMVRNAAESLKEGGYFIITLPNASSIMHRLRKSFDVSSFGNGVYNISFDGSEINPPAIFGCKYRFFLRDVLEKPEYLVSFDAMVQICSKYGLVLERKSNIEEYYKENCEEGFDLLKFMKGLEQVKVADCTNNEEYVHVKNRFKNAGRIPQFVGTISISEWEAISLYMVCAFKKVETAGIVNIDQK